MKIRDICLMSILGIILYISQVVLSFLPNIELVSLLVIIFTLVFKKRIIGILCVFVLMQGLTYGFGTWFIMYLYVWPILAFAAYLFKGMKSRLSWALLSGFFGLLFGALCSFTYLPIGGIPAAIAFFISGIPFDISHCIGNFILALLLIKPLRNTIETLDRKTRVV